MINRRSLRIKAFKNLYSYESCKGANYLMGLDLIDKEFSPDLNSMEIFDQEEMDRKKELALENFSTHFDKDSKTDAHEEVAGEVKEALEFVDKQNKSDFRKLLRKLHSERSIECDSRWNCDITSLGVLQAERIILRANSKN